MDLMLQLRPPSVKSKDRIFARADQRASRHSVTLSDSATRAFFTVFLVAVVWFYRGACDSARGFFRLCSIRLRGLLSVAAQRPVDRSIPIDARARATDRFRAPPISENQRSAPVATRASTCDGRARHEDGPRRRGSPAIRHCVPVCGSVQRLWPPPRPLCATRVHRRCVVLFEAHPRSIGAQHESIVRRWIESVWQSIQFGLSRWPSLASAGRSDRRLIGRSSQKLLDSRGGR
jgi:hypothetical protein